MHLTVAYLNGHVPDSSEHWPNLRQFAKNDLEKGKPLDPI